MNTLTHFNYQGQEIRTVQRDNETWFVLKDVCKALGLSDTNKVAERLDDDELTRTKFVSGGQAREMYAVNESGLYNVMIQFSKCRMKLTLTKRQKSAYRGSLMQGMAMRLPKHCLSNGRRDCSIIS